MVEPDGQGKHTGPRPGDRRKLLTATPPTPNGDLHLGHLSGPYLAADIHRRYLRLRGVESYYISGVDDHQSYVAFKAERLGTTSAEVAGSFGDRMSETLRMARIEVDQLLRPGRSPQYVEFVQRFFTRLHAEGKLLTRTGPALFCEQCDRYLFEAFVRGKCPHCMAASGGNACEDCGRPNDCIDLVEPACNRCGGRPSTRLFTRLYFPLSRYERQLREYHRTAHMNPHLMALCDGMLAEQLPDISVSHVSDWGIPVPVEGFAGQTLYVWFEMAPGYLFATRQMAERLGLPGGWEGFWKSEETEVTQFFGFDNGYFHAILFPALFFAYDSGIRPPRSFVMNEFYRLDGQKFSTSRNHAVWGGEFLSLLPPDTVRFHLGYTSPEAEQTNFTVAEFEEVVRSELVNGLQPWLTELGAKVEGEFDGRAPAPGEMDEDQRRFHHELAAISADVARAYEAETFSPQRATRLLSELVGAARRFGTREAGGLRAREEEQAARRTGVALELLAAGTLCVLAAPVMPDFAAHLWRCLGFGRPLWDGGWESLASWLPAGQPIRGLESPYFADVSGSVPERARPASFGQRGEPRGA